MLELHNIVKKYLSGDNEVVALGGVDLKFRKNEFVSILGASGCGKTTMLNIIGGLDRYTDGDLVINGVSTKKYKDRDWDTYRNHSVGFVFQSYNLIPHQTVLANVELALTLSGVSKSERRQRAKEALKKVGLGDQLHKRPAQMSGGQMQRVAIARALVNNPDILLADEPTGALDTTTSVQIMELLKEVAADRLVIMVTHNPELAEQYSTRIVRLSDGHVIDDTMPYDGEEETADEVVAAKPKKAKKGRKAKTSMSFLTALSLSTNNLLTKKGRTTLTSFAGSIGIIGIALVLALSTGIQTYITQVQEDTLSTYPLSINKTDTDLSAMLGAMTQVSEDAQEEQKEGMIYVDDSMGTMANAMSATVSNNLEAFKIYLDKNYLKVSEYVTDIQYTYDYELQVFTADGKTQISPTTIFKNMGDMYAGLGEMISSSGMGAGFNVMSEMINNQELLDNQYDVVAGSWPVEATDVVLVVSKDNRISLLSLYMIGEIDQSNLEEIMNDLMKGEYEAPDVEPYTYDYFIGKEFYMLSSHEFYSKTDEAYKDADGNIVTDKDGNPYYKYSDDRKTFDYIQEEYVKKGTKLRISGIIRPKAGATAASVSGTIGYTKALTDLILQRNLESDIIKQQKEMPEYNVLTGLKFEKTVFTKDNIHILINSIDNDTMSMMYSMMTERLQKQFAENPPITGKEAFIGFASMMDDSQMSSLLAAMIASVNASDPTGTTAQSLFGTLNMRLALPDITITENNITTLIPSLTPMQKIMTVSIASGFCSDEAMSSIYAYMNNELLSMEVNEENFIMLLKSMGDEEFAEFQNTLYSLASTTDATLESNLKLLGDAEKAKPASINFYAKDFQSKDEIEKFIKEYNDGVEEIDKLQYTDMVGLLMSSISTIINVITYVLIAFVSISLIVSSIMIGIITYISVVERTKEIGILRAIGASKRDISRVFNAETLIVGLISGAIGIASTLILIIPINAIIHAISGIVSVNAILPWQGAAILVAISMVLTIFAGLIPSRVASKKDPVEALRSE